MTDNIIKLEPVNLSKIEMESKIMVALYNEAKVMVINTQAEYDDAARFLKVVKSKFNSIEEQRKLITKPLDEAKRATMELVKQPKKYCEDAEELLKAAMLGYIDKKERERRAIAEKLEREAEAERIKIQKRADAAREKGQDLKAEQLEVKAEMVTAPVVTAQIEQAEGVSVRTVWYAEIRDINAVPREWMVVDLAGLNKVAQTLKERASVPGVVFRSKKVMASR